MQCIILAGGLGTRISSVAGDLPKALIPVAGRAFAFHQLDWLAAQGVTNAVYCIGHKGEMLREAIGNGPYRGMKVAYSDEGPVLRGTGGAIRLALEQGLLDAAFFVLYADSYLTIELEPVWLTSNLGLDPTMVVIKNDGRWDTSNVVLKEGLVERYEKNLPDPAAEGMRFIDYGLSVLNRETIAEQIPPGIWFDLANLYTHLSRSHRLRAHEVSERFYEIGSPSGLAELEDHFTCSRN